MHELSIVLEIVKIVEEYAAENEVGRIEALVLQIGEMSSTVPRYVAEVYPNAVLDTILDGAELKIEVMPGVARCRDCGHEFKVREHKGICPVCLGKNLEVVSGREFHIKEIVVVDS
jgi:hydrogenase nickel incorporation protein HypA/HybF